jgi:hypothetical protein
VDLAIFFFQFFNQYTFDRIPWTGDQPLTAHRTTQTWNNRTQTPMPRVEFEPTIPAFERAKTVQALDNMATVIGIYTSSAILCTRKKAIFLITFFSLSIYVCMCTSLPLKRLDGFCSSAIMNTVTNRSVEYRRSSFKKRNNLQMCPQLYYHLFH